jgi:hypothetical protein
MEELTVLRTFSAVTTVLAAALVAAKSRYRHRLCYLHRSFHQLDD